jgi:N-carbamoyl-L-amino-acid hydrolase
VSPVRDAAERLGYSHMDIVSGAGHDACWINDVAPTAMVMCPCVDGLSHNEAEEISPRNVGHCVDDHSHQERHHRHGMT